MYINFSYFDLDLSTFCFAFILALLAHFVLFFHSYFDLDLPTLCFAFAFALLAHFVLFLIYLHCALHHSSVLLFFFGAWCSSMHFNVVVYILIVMFAFWCYSCILQLSMFGLFDHIHASSSFFLLLCSLSLLVLYIYLFIHVFLFVLFV